MEQRRTRRFCLQLPVAFTGAGGRQASEDGLTRNISSCGVLFTSASGADPGGPIEYVITVGEADARRVLIRCMGKVVRCEPVENGTRSYHVAATLDRYEFVRG